MKIGLEEQLFKIDEAFAQKTQKDIYMIYIMIFAAIFIPSYMLLWDGAENKFHSIQKQISAIQSKINVDNAYLNANPATKIVDIENETKRLMAESKQYQDYNAYVKYQINQISSLFYNEKSWGEYLDSIVDNSKKYSIKMLNFNNEFTDNTFGFGHVLNINIKGYGDYLNMLKFINSLEQSFLVIDLHGFELKATETLNADLNISVWGITY